LFGLSDGTLIDGAEGGNATRHINHSCEPNLVARIVRGHILYVSARNIRKGEELTVDYRFDKNVEKVPCSCGAGACRGTINVVE
jgi:SET domain-containing protein